MADPDRGRGRHGERVGRVPGQPRPPAGRCCPNAAVCRKEVKRLAPVVSPSSPRSGGAALGPARRRRPGVVGVEGRSWGTRTSSARLRVSGRRVPLVGSSIVSTAVPPLPCLDDGPGNWRVGGRRTCCFFLSEVPPADNAFSCQRLRPAVAPHPRRRIAVRVVPDRGRAASECFRRELSQAVRRYACTHRCTLPHQKEGKRFESVGQDRFRLRCKMLRYFVLRRDGFRYMERARSRSSATSPAPRSRSGIWGEVLSHG